MEDRTLLSTFTVSNLADSGPGSLRQAILDSNALTGGNTIDFDIPGSGVQTITLSSGLPTITTAVLIDGYSQPGASPNTEPQSDNATLEIALYGYETGDADGLDIGAANVTVRGLVIDYFGYGIHLLGSGGQDVVAGNFIGVDASGIYSLGGNYGVFADQVGQNTIGGTTPADRNIISGNSYGIYASGAGSSGNVIQGNFLGVDASGNVSRANFWYGIDLESSSANTIGGTSLGAGNVISGNYVAGVYGEASSGNAIQGNFIGTNASGTAPLGNSYYNRGGIVLDSSSGNTIGGTSLGAGNLISGNYSGGVTISNGVAGATGNLIQGNLIGTDVTGTLALGNVGPGVGIYDASGTTVGGTILGAGNLIADNGGPGVAIVGDVGSVDNPINGNRIFGNAGLPIDLGDDGPTPNALAPRQGPNNFQNYPIIVKTADGQLMGGLDGSTPDTVFHVEIFASAGLSSLGVGEAEVELGSLDVTTDSQGQVFFAIPFAVPADKPIVTATATDPEGNTSELSPATPRQPIVRIPTQTLLLSPGSTVFFSVATGNTIAIQDPDAAPFDLPWNLSLSVTAGTLSLAGTNGLVGSGDGTGTLQYQGTISALDAALAGMSYSPEPGFHGLVTLSFGAQSPGATPIQAHVELTDRIFPVTTTADSGPGSLRQAILDSNVATGRSNLITFAIPGGGAQSIVLASPLPAISNPLLIDGWSEPGFAGAPLIALHSQSAGDFDSLPIASPSVTVRGLSINRFAGGIADSYRIDTTTDERLVAQVHDQDSSTALLLVDAQGHLLMQSDGQSTSNPDDLIDLHVPAGSVFLDVVTQGGAGTYTLTTTLAPANPQFQPIPVVSNPAAIVAGDFAGDGRTDLAVAIYSYDSPGIVSVLMGNGDGTFQPGVQYAVGSGPSTPEFSRPGIGMVAGDFTGNGHLDLAVANTGDSTVSVLLGNGDGTFQPQVTFATDGDPGSLVAGDFNGDGRTDLAVLDDGVEVFLSNGNGTFHGQHTSEAGTQPISLVAADFNGDGKLDLAAAFFDAGVEVLLGDGDGSFQPTPVIYDARSQPVAIAAGDWNGDGRADLVAAYDSGPDLDLLLGNGDGTFQAARQIPFNYVGEDTSLVTGDLNGDGRLDLAVAEGSSVIIVILGNGDGTFQPYQSTGVGADSLNLVTADFNGDGELDLAVTSNNNNGDAGSVSILLGNGNGAFQSKAQSPAVPNPSVIVAGDFTGNGRLDLAISDADGIQVLLGNGDGTFQPAVTVASGFGGNLVAGDFNGDGRLDLAVDGGGTGSIGNFDPGYVSILLGNGDGTFQAPQQLPTGEFQTPGSMVVGDFNGDGRLDLAVADGGNLFWDGTDPPGVIVVLGNGDGTFQPQVTYQVNYAGPSQPGFNVAGAVVAGDFDGDGRLDLAVAMPGAGVTVLLGNGDGTFHRVPENFATGFAWQNSAAVGDFNGDGHLDLAVTNNFDSNVSVLLGNGDGTFQPQVTHAVGSSPGSIMAGDFTGNGRVDLAVTDGAGEQVLLGNGDGTFQPPVTYDAGSPPAAIVAGDFNGDGRAGLAGAGPGNTVSMLLGYSDGTFADPGQLATTPQATPLVVDSSGDGTDDALVVDGAGDILDRRGNSRQPGTFLPPVIINPGDPSRDIAWLPSTVVGPVLASVDAHDNTVSLYAYRNGGFVRLNGSLATGGVPEQIIAADLTGDGFTDLVVRNAGDGTLSVYFGTAFGSIGPIDPVSGPPSFLTPVILNVGKGVTDVQAIDTTGSGRLDLVTTNKLSAEVSVVLNLGDGKFAPPVRYRAGTEPSEIDGSSGSPQVTSLEETSGVVAVPLVAGGPIDLVTINPGSNTLGVLASLGGGRFANPVALRTASPAEVLRLADFSADGIPDLAVLDAQGVSIYLGNGKGGFLPAVTYDAGPEASGLTLADVNDDGKLDLLVGDVFGDVLVLLGQGNGAFEPYHDANQSIELAVADLTGNGSKDVIYADAGLDRVVVDYGPGNSSVLGNQSTGLLDPGAVKLADLNGDGIPDLIVANTGSNNVLIYPGLGNGQFGPALNRGHGYFVGTNPIAIAVANLNGQPDVLVADAGSNDVDILLGHGSGASWTLGPGPRIKTQGGPDALAVGSLTGSGQPDLFVANSQANTVEQFQGIGSGDFNDQNPTIYPVGQAPSALFLGNFGQGLGLATLNAGSNDGTLISGLSSASPLTQTFATGGERPATGFAGDFTGNGLTDLVVGNSGDGHLALLMAGAGGLSLSQTLVSPQALDPTGLSFGAVSNGELSFYVSSAGREAATILAFDLGGVESEAGIVTPGTGLSLAGVLSQATSGSVQQVAQLLSLTGSNLDLAATLLTVSVLPGNFDSESSGGAPATVSSSGPGQSMAQNKDKSGPGGPGDELEDQPEGVEADARPAVKKLPAWERLSIGLERAWERARTRILELENRPPVANRQNSTAPPAVSQPSRPPARLPAQPTRNATPDSKSDAKSTGAITPQGAGGAVDAALEEIDAQQQTDGRAVRGGFRSWDEPVQLRQPATTRALVAMVAAAAAWRVSLYPPSGRRLRRLAPAQYSADDPDRKRF